MRYFDGEIKHLDGFKYNCGERVKHYIIFNNDGDEHDPLIRSGVVSKRAIEVNPDDPYDTFNMRSSFCDTTFFHDGRVCRNEKLDEAKERECIREFLNGFCEDEYNDR